MDIGLKEMLTLSLHVVVGLQGILALTSVAVVASLVLKLGWDRRFMAYAYELGLVMLYGHFILCGPIAVSTAIANLVYWAALIGLAPLSAAPIVLEWKELSKLRTRRIIRWSKMQLLLSLAALSVLLTFFLAWLLYTFIRMLQGINME